MARKGDRPGSVLLPRAGIFLDRPPIAVPQGGLQDGRNFRIQDGKIERLNIGWGPFLDAPLDGPCLLIDPISLRSGTQALVFGTDTDLLKYVSASEVVYLTPRYETGLVDVEQGSTTVNASGTVPTTAWTTSGLSAGDKISFGEIGQVSPGAEWYEIDSITGDDALELTEQYAGYSETGIAYTARKLFQGDSSTIWDTEIFANAQIDTALSGVDMWYATNAVDPVVAWDVNDDQVRETDLGFTCRLLKTFQGSMIYADITIGGERRSNSFWKSAVGQPEEVVSGGAQELQVHRGTAAIVAVEQLADQLVFYCDDRFTMAQFVSGDLQYIFRDAVLGTQAIAQRAVADFGDYHEILTNEGKARFDGIRMTRIDTHLFREVIRKHSPSRRPYALRQWDEERGDLHWIVPLATDTTEEPTTSFVEHYLEPVAAGDPTPHSVRDLPAMCAGYYARQSTLTFDQIAESWADQGYRWNDQFLQAAFPFSLFGTLAGEVMTLNSTDSQAGSSITSYVRTGRWAAIDGRIKGLLARLYPYLDNLYGTITIRVYGANQVAGAASFLGEFTYDMSGSDPVHEFIAARVADRFFELEFAISGVGVPFLLQGWDLEVRPWSRR